MAVRNSTLESLKDLLHGLGPVSVRRMFGGVGLFSDGLMFALVDDDELYLKADDASRADFEAEGLPPFSYETSGGRHTIMSYWRAPERVLDDPDEMRAWAGKAMAAARRAAGRKSKAGTGRGRKRAPSSGRR
jgi:DNA transformation protein